MAEIGHNKPAVDISFSELRALLDETSETAAVITSATGKHRAKIKEIVEAQDWQKTAFGDIRKIDNMNETALVDYLRTFKALFDIMWENKWAAMTKDLLSDLDEDGQEEQEDQTEDEGSDDE